MTKDRRTTWEGYVESWRATSMQEKRRLFEQCLSPNCVYIDPLARTRGWDELAAYMTEFHRQVPGGHFVTEQFITHHGKAMARWQMLNGDGVAMGEGVSYAEYDEAGRLTTMAAFFETPTS